MQPLLTIAIPTYNRADILHQTLDRLTRDAAFDPRKIELLVSDNASTDQTAEVVASFPSITYHRNPQNIGFANFTVAISLAKGRYVRLMNDTASFIPGMLGVLLNRIEQTDSSKVNLFFYNSLTHIKKATLEVADQNQFVGTVSYLITWIVNFGIWKTDFSNLPDPDRLVGTLMQHVDWSLCCASNGKKNLLVIDEFIEVHEVKKKGSYNLFDTFITKYLSILKVHRIKRSIFQKEKYRLFRYFLLPWYIKLQKDKEYQFDTHNADKVIFRNYWQQPYYWLLMAYHKIKELRRLFAALASVWAQITILI